MKNWDLFKRHKILSVIVFIISFLLVVSLMDCFDFGTLSRILFSGGVFLATILFGSIKKLNEYMHEQLNKIKEKSLWWYKAVKLTTSIFVAACIVGGFSYCLFSPVRDCGKFIVDQAYPKYVVSIGNLVVNSVTEFTTGNDGAGGDKNSSDKTDGRDDKYIACQQSTMLVSVDCDDCIVDDKLIDKYFHGISKVYSKEEISAILEEDIYSLYSSRSNNKSKPELLIKKMYEIQDTEDSIIANKDAGKKFAVNSTKWRETVPTTDEMIDLANSREDLISRGYKDYNFYKLLSNNYQDIADEYLYVSLDRNEEFKSQNAIIYYYCKSIEADKQTLSMAEDDNERIACLQRIAARYIDMADCEIIDSEIRESAELIGNQIREDFNIRK